MVDPLHQALDLVSRRARRDLARRPRGRQNGAVLVGGLLGRERPLALVREVLGFAAEGHGGLVLVGGEAGIGKTALVATIADEARRQSMYVLNGTCWDGLGAPGYWPWIQVVRALERVAPRWREMPERAYAGVARLLGETEDEIRSTSAADGGFQVYDAVTRLLTSVAQERPTLVALEDLHWADLASLRLLEFLVRHTQLESLLVIGTYRDTEADSEAHPIRSTLLGLESRATTVLLGGVDRVSVAALMARTAGEEPSAKLVDDVYTRTGGNPFFVEQTARLWSTARSVEGIPPGVREAVRERLARLPGDTLNVLCSAALIGTGFDLSVLAGATNSVAADLARQLQRAVAARLLAEALPGDFRFVHDLVRETLVDLLSVDERRTRYATIAQGVERAPELKARVLPAQLAQCAYLGVPRIDPALAVEYLLAAGQDAAKRVASDEACLHYRRALELIPEQDQRARFSVMARLGLEEQRAGDIQKARGTFRALLDAADEIDDAAFFARAALGLHGLGSSSDTQLTQIDLQQEALRRLQTTGDGEGPLAAQLMAATSREHTHHIGGSRVEAEALSARAVELARASGDPAALTFCLLARHDAIWRAGTSRERLGVADEMTAVATRFGHSELEMQASLLRMVALLEQGEPRALDEAASFFAMVDRAGLPRMRYLARSRQATLAILQGRFAQARVQMDEALAFGQQLGEADALSVWGDQFLALQHLQGWPEAAEAEAFVARLRADRAPHTIVAETIIALDRGDAAAALARRDEIMALRHVWPRWAELVWLSLEAELAVASGSPTVRQAARAALIPFVENWAVVGGAVIVHGPLALSLAMLDRADRRWDEAIAGFRAAQRAAERLNARPWSIEARFGLAETLLSRGASGDAVSAGRLLGDVEREAGELGMHAVRRRLASIRERAHASEHVFRSEGEIWHVTFAGRSVAVPHAKGMQDLHMLLSRARIDVPVRVLIDPNRGGEWAGPAASMAVIDQQAKAAYRQRLVSLATAIDEALEEGEDARAQQLDAERDSLIAELRRAAGLGGRTREFSNDAERARKTVSARIRDTLRHLDHRHPELASHLRQSVTMGSSCRYQPSEDIDWVLK
jgi:tetratricopeptide (TPR) repeat protein